MESMLITGKFTVQSGIIAQSKRKAVLSVVATEGGRDGEKRGGGASVQGLLHRRTLSSHKASGFVIDANGLRVATKKFTGIRIPFRK